MTRITSIYQFGLIVAAGVLFQTSAQSALVIEFSEGQGTVDVAVSGSLDLSATLGRAGSGTHSPSMFNPSRGFLLTGNRVRIDWYNINSLVTPFGTGDNSPNAIEGVGDRVALFANLAIGLPDGYVSGEELFSTNSWSGSFESLGLVVGEYVTNFSNGNAADSITVSVVPEPSVGLIALLSGTVLFLRYRNRY